MFKPHADETKQRAPRQLRRPMPSGKSLADVARGITADSCYFCGLETRHDYSCPELAFLIFRAGQCWDIMGTHFRIQYVEDGYITGFADFSSHRTSHTLFALRAMVVRPRQISRCCMCTAREHWVET